MSYSLAGESQNAVMVEGAEERSKTIGRGDDSMGREVQGGGLRLLPISENFKKSFHRFCVILRIPLLVSMRIVNALVSQI
jgi:hypothetical protein